MADVAAPLWLMLLPGLGAAAVTLLRERAAAARTITMLAFMASLLIATHTLLAYHSEASGFDQHVSLLGVSMHLGIDGFNLYLVLLTALLFPVVLGCTWRSVEAQRPLYLALLLLLQAGLFGTFLAQNLLLFFVCWEAVLIPMGVLIYVFGGRRRRAAAYTFFLYTLAGSVLLLAAVIALGAESFRQTGAWSFELSVIQNLPLDASLQAFVFVSIMLACLVKCPLVPFHSWLPLAYQEAPASGTALMAGVLSKMGAFGVLKLAIPLAPAAAAVAAPYLVTLAAISIVYGALLALTQREYKRLIAYASLSHMGYIVLGAFTFQQAALHGAMLQMLSHGVAVAGLFLLLGKLEEQSGVLYSRTTALASTSPRLAVLFMLFVLTSIALPLTSGFSAEFLILFGALTRGVELWRADGDAVLLIAGALAATGMVLGAAYMLRFARALLFGRRNELPAPRDLRLTELAPFAALLVIVAWVGVAPAAFIDKTQDAAHRLAAFAPRLAPPPVIADARSEHER